MNNKYTDELYREIMQAIINRQKEILGVKVAVDTGKQVPELRLAIDGEILGITGDHEAVLQSLVNEYYHLTTEAGLEENVEVVRAHLKKKNLELPEEIVVLLKDKN